MFDLNGPSIFVRPSQKELDAESIAREVAGRLGYVEHEIDYNANVPYFRSTMFGLLLDPSRPSYATWFRAVRYAALSMAEDGRRPDGLELELRAEKFLKELS